MAHTLKQWNEEAIKNLDKEYRRNLVNCLSGYKSACLLGTTNGAGSHNVAIFSQLIHIGAHPPLMGVLFRPDVVPRHSLENIRLNGQFTLNHISEGFYKQAHQTSARYDRNESEFEATGLTPDILEGFDAPFVKESFLRIGLHVKEEHRIITNQTILMVGEIVVIQLPESAVGPDGFVYLERLKSVAVSGLDHYHLAQALERLPYAKK